MYRFRSIASLLDRYNELENQEIYFASQEELNDPMEGYKDIYWCGDSIVWRNFLRNYIKSLEHFFVLTIIVENTKRVNENDITVAFNKIDTVIPKAVSKQIEEELLNDNFFRSLPKLLEKKKSPVRRSELAFYLRFIHPIIINTISENYYKHGLCNKKHFYSEVNDLRKLLSKFPIMLRLMNMLEKRDSNLVEFTFAFMQKTSLEMSLRAKYDLPDIELASNRFFLQFEFPEKFIERLETLVYPAWYGASFIKDYHNSSVWGHYGDNHKGVCLKFKVNENEKESQIHLKTEHGYADGPIIGMRPHTFHKIEYNSKHVEIDFFRSLGRDPIPMLNYLWYSDEKGNLSICSDEYRENEEEWRNNYWDNYLKSSTVKLEEWSYEEEFRLIVHDWFVDYRDPNKRKLQYNFMDLEAVIFGIKTSQADKIRIIKIIERKCKANNRDSFTFYQAYYSKRTGKIEIDKLNILSLK